MSDNDTDKYVIRKTYEDNTGDIDTRDENFTEIYAQAPSKEDAKELFDHAQQADTQ